MTDDKCGGPFKHKISKDLNVPVPVRDINLDDCDIPSEWRVTYMKGSGLEPVNCCMRCLTYCSGLHLIYSVVRLAGGK